MRKTRRRISACTDCGCRMTAKNKSLRRNRRQQRGFNFHYMLKDEVWKGIFKQRRGLLCLICAQLRLGRKFVPTDFKFAPINYSRHGALNMLFPDEFEEHMAAFVGKEKIDPTKYDPVNIIMNSIDYEKEAVELERQLKAELKRLEEE